MNEFKVDEIEKLIRIGEGLNVEFKRDFDWRIKEKKLKYIKGMVGLHNHDGGYMLFGVEDGGNILGLGADFEKLDNIEITQTISNYFQPSIHKWVKSTVKINGFDVGVIYVYRREGLPAVCKVDHQGIYSESDIYFRYNAASSKIKHGDLIKMLSELSALNQINETRKIRMNEIKPFIKVRTGLCNNEETKIEIQNSSKNAAIIKEIIMISIEGLTFDWKAPQEYGYSLPPGAEFRIAAKSKNQLAYDALYHFQINYADQDGNFYSQIYSGKPGKHNETEPKLKN